MANILAVASDGSFAEVAQASATKALTVASTGDLAEITASGTQKVLSLASDGSLQEISVTFGGVTVRQFLLAGYGAVNANGTRQHFIPGYGQLNEE